MHASDATKGKRLFIIQFPQKLEMRMIAGELALTTAAKVG
jgi:hypothetical protein